MENAKRLVEAYLTSTTLTGDKAVVDTASNQVISEQSKQLINMVFVRFSAIYGHKFKSVFSDKTELKLVKREWALSLDGYSENELVLAINQVKLDFAWMPSIAEFIKILEQIRNPKLAAVQQAYLEACRYAADPEQHQWSHELVYLAGKATGWFKLKAAEAEQALADFTYHYQVLIHRAQAGEDLTVAVPVALADKTDDTVWQFIQSWGQEQQLADGEAESLLYYLLKPKGSAIRARLRAQAKLQAQTLSIDLPEED